MPPPPPPAPQVPQPGPLERRQLLHWGERLSLTQVGAGQSAAVRSRGRASRPQAFKLGVRRFSAPQVEPRRSFSFYWGRRKRRGNGTPVGCFAARDSSHTPGRFEKPAQHPTLHNNPRCPSPFQPNLSTREPLLALRRQLAGLLGDGDEAGRCWLQQAKLCRWGGRLRSSRVSRVGRPALA